MTILMRPNGGNTKAMTVVEISDDDAAALTVKAARQGLTLEDWIKNLVQDEKGRNRETSDPYPLQSVANIVLDAMREVPLEIRATMPSDGASEHDHYIYGTPSAIHEACLN